MTKRDREDLAAAAQLLRHRRGGAAADELDPTDVAGAAAAIGRKGGAATSPAKAAAARVNGAKGGVAGTEAQLEQRLAALAARPPGRLGGRPRTVEVAWRRATRRAAELVRLAILELLDLGASEPMVLRLKHLADSIDELAMPEKNDG